MNARRRKFRECLALAAVFALPPAVGGAIATEPPDPSWDRFFAVHFQATSPRDYVAAVIEVQKDCEERRGGHCLDRVRLIDVLARAVPAGRRPYASGDDLLLIGRDEEAHDDPRSRPAGLRMLAVLIPHPIEGMPGPEPDQAVDYGAVLLQVDVDPASIGSLRGALGTAGD